MRRITAWVAIIAVPTAVTGFFGQNVPYPGFAKTSGFIASAVIMACVAIVLYITSRPRNGSDCNVQTHRGRQATVGRPGTDPGPRQSRIEGQQRLIVASGRSGLRA